jgi:hypothetical protein
MLAVYSANVVKNATHAQVSAVQPGQGAVGGTAWQAPSPALHYLFKTSLTVKVDDFRIHHSMQ